MAVAIVDIGLARAVASRVGNAFQFPHEVLVLLCEALTGF